MGGTKNQSYDQTVRQSNNHSIESVSRWLEKSNEKWFEIINMSGFTCMQVSVRLFYTKQTISWLSIRLYSRHLLSITTEIKNAFVVTHRVMKEELSWYFKGVW